MNELFNTNAPIFQGQMQSLQTLQNLTRGLSYTQPSTDLLRVKGIEGVKAFATSMQPNSRVPLFEEDDDVFWVVSTDANCTPTFNRFRFIPEADPSTVPMDAKFVTIDEFNKFKEEIVNAQQLILRNRSNDVNSDRGIHTDSATWIDD